MDSAATAEHRETFARDVEYRTWIYEHAPPWGFVYTCPRCAWKSRGMRWRFGAISEGRQHALACEAPPLGTV